MRTLAEIIAMRLALKGYVIHRIRQPVPTPQSPGQVVFHTLENPAIKGIVYFWERFRGYHTQIEEMIRQAERKRKLAEDAWQTETRETDGS